MPTGVAGKKIIYKYRRLSQAGSTAAWLIAFVSENGRTVSIDADSTATKDGSIRTPSVPEIEITSKSILAVGDERIQEIEDAMLNNELFEIWEINLEDPANDSGKYKGKYFQGYCTEMERSSAAEDMTEIDLTFGVNGTGARGDCTVSAAEIAAATYAFADTTAAGA